MHACRGCHALLAALHSQDAIAALQAENVSQIVLLPLYPQYSYATTRSSLNEWNRVYGTRSLGVPVKTVESYYDHPDYIAALGERIETAMAPLEQRENVHLVFSAHGLPLKLVQAGDPYPKQIEETVRRVLALGGYKNPHTLCFQSRVGPQKWLEPSLSQTIERLGRQGVKRMMVVPVAFVTEHIETLHEINVEAREQAEKLGVEEFTMMPALNDSPLFISALGRPGNSRRELIRIGKFSECVSFENVLTQHHRRHIKTASHFVCLARFIEVSRGLTRAYA